MIYRPMLAAAGTSLFDQKTATGTDQPLLFYPPAAPGTMSRQRHRNFLQAFQLPQNGYCQKGQDDQKE
jgi:hypothetical protein